jgi:hypothetical protein
MRPTWRILPLTPALARVRMPRFWGLRAKRFLQVVTEGPFEDLLGEATERWLAFCAALAEERYDRAILRLYAGEDVGGPYFLWLTYRLVPGPEAPGMRLESMALPTEDSEGRLETPEELEGEPFFAYPPGEMRMP